MKQELPSILSGVYVLKLFCVVLRGQLSIFLVFSCLLVITLLVHFTLPNIPFAIYKSFCVLRPTTIYDVVPENIFLVGR